MLIFRGVGIVSLPSFLRRIWNDIFFSPFSRRIPWRSTILTKGCDVWEAPSPTGENTIVSYHITSTVNTKQCLEILCYSAIVFFFLGGLATSKSDALRCLFTGISLHDLGTEREGVEPWYVGVHVSGWATFPTMLFFSLRSFPMPQFMASQPTLPTYLPPDIRPS